MRIGELARRTGVDVQTIRYYEWEGLLAAPARETSGYRSYEPEHLEQLKFIRHCRSLSMSLEEIRRMLSLSRSPTVSCESVNTLIDVQLRRVRAQRAVLDQLEKQLGQLRAQCRKGHHVADCGIFRELMHAAHGEACACHGANPA
jgi:Cd(II)/Pb(II)-responsive transcriptional regulator